MQRQGTVTYRLQSRRASPVQWWHGGWGCSDRGSSTSPIKVASLPCHGWAGVSLTLKAHAGSLLESTYLLDFSAALPRKLKIKAGQ